jgi:hypothetical protein
VETVNAKVDSNTGRQRVLAETQRLQTESDRLTAAIEAARTEKQRRIEAVKYPVPGLEIDGKTVRFNGVPFSQASKRQRYTVSAKIGALSSPGLRLGVIEDGSLYDAEGRREIREVAEELGMLFLMEIVADNTDGRTGIIVEDGRAFRRTEQGVMA